MTGPRIARAIKLVAQIELALAAAGIDNVLVTVDGAKVPNASRLRSGSAIVLRPPVLRFPTFDTTEVEWEVVAVSGPANNVLAAWGRLDAIVAALAPAMNFDQATPADFQPLDGPTIPAYSLTYNDPE